MPVKTILNHINGQFVRGRRDFPDLNPANGTVIAQVSEAGEISGFDDLERGKGIDLRPFVSGHSIHTADTQNNVLTGKAVRHGQGPGGHEPSPGGPPRT